MSNWNLVFDTWRRVQAAQGSNAKKFALQEGESTLLKDLLRLTYDPYITFGLKLIPKYVPTLYPRDPDNLLAQFQLFLLRLSSREITGGAAIDEFREFLGRAEREQAEFFKCMIERDLKWGLAAKSINKVFKCCIPTFDVALAKKIEDPEKEIQFPTIVQAKLDGVRCIAVKYNNKVQLYSRRGKILENFPQIENELLGHIKGDIILDGEIMGEDFQKLMTQVHRKEDIDTRGSIYHVFDCMDYLDWVNKESLIPYSARVKQVERIITDMPHVQAVPYEWVENIEEFTERYEHFLDLGYEGIMVKNPDSGYEFKRSKSLLKYKPTKTVDLQVIGYQYGTGKYEGTLGALVCEYKNNCVHVGSGYSDEERKAIWDLREDIVGRIIEVQYQEATINKHGEHSLRFPIYMGIRKDKTEANIDD